MGALGRVAGLLVMLLLAWRVLARGTTFAPAGLVIGVLDGANFLFHEAGHILFVFFGDFLTALGGSLTQVAMPALCAAYFVFRRQSGAAAAALFWTGESLAGVAIYMADARVMALPLHGGAAVTHDWNYLLGRLGLVAAAETLGRLTFAVAALLILGALALLALDLLRVWGSAERGGERSSV